MTRTTPLPALLASTLALAALLPAAAHAQAPAPPAGDDKALAEARADLARAAARVAELSRPGAGAGKVHVEQRILRRPVIGVLLTPDEEAGVRISGVTPGSAAASAGLRSGDRLLSVAGSRILGSDGSLRVDNARRLLREAEAGKPVRLGYVRGGRSASVEVTPRLDERVYMWSGDDGSLGKFEAPVTIRRHKDGRLDIESRGFEIEPGMGIAPQIHREIVRIGADGSCRGEDCRAPRLLSALRWNGLNLASVDARLGRYFGTDRGVLVLSSGALEGLQAGDVIQRVDGKAVTSPREVMAALRGKPDDARVAVDYLRDRKPVSAQVTVPKLLDALPPPPAPPAPPTPPSARPAPPPSPPAPPKAMRADGLQPSLALAPPPPAPAAPPAAPVAPAPPPPPPPAVAYD